MVQHRQGRNPDMIPQGMGPCAHRPADDPHRLQIQALAEHPSGNLALVGQERAFVHRPRAARALGEHLKARKPHPRAGGAGGDTASPFQGVYAVAHKWPTGRSSCIWIASKF